MTSYADFFPDLALGALLLLAATAAAALFGRMALPAPAAFLAVGITGGLLGLAPIGELQIVTVEQIGAVGLYFILFQGGLSTGWGAWRRDARPILTLGLPGTAATALALAVVGHYVLGFGWAIASLVAVALAPTDPAAVYAVLRGRDDLERPRTILEGESGINDPVAISLAVTVTAIATVDHASYEESVWRFFEEFALGAVLGIVGGLALILALRLTPQLEESVRAVSMLLAVVLLGAFTTVVHGSGFLAVYAAGLVLSDAWSRQTRRSHAVPEALSAGSELVLFAMLGAVLAPLVGASDVAQGVALTLFTVFLLRPTVATLSLLGSGLERAERALVSWGGLKGAVPLLLGAYAGTEGFEDWEKVAAVVLAATAASLVVQGSTVQLVAARSAAR